VPDLSLFRWPLLAIGDWSSNAVLIADIARHGRYLNDDMTIIDLTYGEAGGFWTVWTPTHLTACDLNPDISPIGYSVDAAAPPAHLLGRFDAVVVDPPYKCVSLDTEIMTRAGWRTWAECQVGDEVYTLNHESGLGEWQPVQHVHVLPAEPRQMVEISGKSHSSLTTHDHRWPVVDYQGRRTWATSTTFGTGHRVQLCARHANQPTETVHDDALVELVAWFWTEGHIDGGRSGAVGSGAYGKITQSHAVNPNNCERIYQCFEKLYGPPVERFPRLSGTTDGVLRWRVRTEGRNTLFIFSADVGRELLRHAPHKVVSRAFIDSLTSDQLELFIGTSLAADGTRSPIGTRRLTQRLEPMAEAFQYACTLAGIATSTSHHPHLGHTVNLRNRTHIRMSRKPAQVTEQTCAVWCVTVPNHTWLARRNGYVYFTGNCNGTPTAEVDARYGVHVVTSRDDRHDLMLRMLAGALQVARPEGYVLYKSMAQVNSGRKWWQPDMVARHAETLGARKVDEFHYRANVRPQPDRKVNCPDCKATGFVGVMKPLGLCDTCDGTGKIVVPFEQKHAASNFSTLTILQAGTTPAPSLF